ncbi:MAG: response regulator [Desulfobacteraceae bacterium]|nr:response regulator [Desulfobacteraceae bacterium]
MKLTIKNMEAVVSILTITNGLYTNSEEIIQILGKKFNYRILTDADLIEKTHHDHDIRLATLQKVLDSRPIAFNDFTHEKERCISALKKTLSDFVSEGNCIFHGALGHLIPKTITHVMRVLVIAEKNQRIKNAEDKKGLSKKEALKKIELSDKHAFLWTASLFNEKAWNKSLYDIVIPSDKIDTKEAVELISKYLNKLLFTHKDLIKQEALDFKLIADIELALDNIGQGLLVESHKGDVVVTIDKKVMLLTKFQQKIIQTTKTIPGVNSVETKIGQNYYKGNIIHNYEFETPLRILLVDDEKEFVQTLSERLKMRQFTNEIVYNGQAALNFTDEEDPEVILLDLKMPGIDGFEVLKTIKKTKPHIEVIILTGHGSKADKATCMDLGAFAYLQKPADIDLITQTMKKAYEKIEAQKE